MGWIRVSDDFYDNDKLGLVGPLGVALYFAAMGFCNRKLSDGYFAKNKARMLLDFDGIEVTTVRGEFFAAGIEGDGAAKLVIEWMVAADLWHEQGHACDECHARADGGEPAANEYLIHDYLEFQPSKAEVEAKAESNRKRVEAWREARKGGNTGSNGVGNALHTSAVTVPVQDTPNPNPNPTVISNEITKGGGVSGVRHQDVEPSPRCLAHIDHVDPPPCHGCRKAREANQAWQAGELDRKRQLREERQRLQANCSRCGGTNTYEDETGVHPCDHQEAAHA